MRVIAGEFRSRRLKPVAGDGTRPTPDRLREALFSILQPVIEGSVFVDAYAGTGAVGIEALSRGAKQTIFLEHSRAALTVLEENLHALGIGNRGRVVRGRVSKALPMAAQAANIVFLDPPYELEVEYKLSLDYLGAHPVPLVIVQHHSKHALEEAYGALCAYRTVRQGENVLSFFTPEDAL